jgi:hypothetical protein
MSEVKVNKLSPRSGTTVTLGDSGDTFTLPAGVTLNASSATLSGVLAAVVDDTTPQLGGGLDLNSNNITGTGNVTITGTILPTKAYIAEATLTDGATIDWDMSTEAVAKVTLAGNRTLNAPTNGSTGQFASILVIQDGTGSRTLTWNAVYEFTADTAPTLTTTANYGDLFTFRYNGAKWLEVGRNLNLVLS